PDRRSHRPAGPAARTVHRPGDRCPARGRSPPGAGERHLQDRSGAHRRSHDRDGQAVRLSAAMTMPAANDAALDRRAAALADERRALLDHDVELLMRSTGEKLAALRELEDAVPQGQGERLAELAEANRRNGALLARRRREV